MSRLKVSPVGYWNESKCRKVAMECKSVDEFREAYEGRAHSHAKKLAIMKVITRDMYDGGYWPMPQKKPSGYWTLEKCKNVCMSYDNQADLMRDHHDVYSAIKEHGWQLECFAPMKGKKRPNGYWTLERCKAEAMKYNNPAAMKRGDPKAYSAMKSHGWYEMCCAEMKARRVPNNYWTEERIKEVMMKTITRTDFQKDYPGAYGAAISIGIYERLTKMMVCLGLWKEKNTKRRKRIDPMQKWTAKMAMDCASKYNSLYEFRNEAPKAYHALLVRGLLDVGCKHMKRRHVPKGYWNKERVMDKADASESLMDFRKHFNAAYQAALANGWLKDVKVVLGLCQGNAQTKQCISSNKPFRWTVDKAKEAIATCKDYHDFRTRYNGCWNFLCDRNLLEELTSHLERRGDLYHRRIYVFEFTDGHAYVGLTKDPEERYKKHTEQEKTSAVYQYIQRTDCDFVFKLLTSWLDKDEASHEEERWRQRYLKDGWQMLNRVRCGSLGGWHGVKYTMEDCQRESAKYKTRKEFYNKNMAMYAYANKHYGLDVVCPHMPKNASIKWPINRIERQISKYGTMPEIKRKDPLLFSRIDNLRLVDKYFVLIKGVRVVREEYMSAKVRRQFIKKYGSVEGYKKYSLQDCQKVARKYKTRCEFKNKDNTMYDFAHRNYDMDEVCGHMPKNASHKWDIKKIKTKIGKYETMAQIRIDNKSLYSFILRKHLQEIYFDRINLPNGKHYYVVKREYKSK